MFDDLEILRENPQLLWLFSHYAKLAEPHRETWHGRLMEMEGVGATELAQLHGELIAFDWIEQNTGQTPCCYRLTFAGLRAYRELQMSLNEGASDLESAGNQAA